MEDRILGHDSAARRPRGGGRRTPGLVRDGDEIELDVEERRLDLLVSDDELERRRRMISEDAGMDSAQTSNEYAVRGYVRLYREHVMQADAGCDFDILREGG
jgi:dihydroxy-acid dehydratase